MKTKKCPHCGSDTFPQDEYEDPITGILNIFWKCDYCGNEWDDEEND